jgi:hypothetical protein
LLKQNYILDKYYHISAVGSNQIYFVAKTKSTLYNPATPNSCTNAGIVFTAINDAVDPQYFDKYHMVLDVYVKEFGATEFTRIGTIPLVPDSNSRCKFYIQDIIHGFQRIDNAPFSTSLFFVCQSINLEYYFALSEIRQVAYVSNTSYEIFYTNAKKSNLDVLKCLKGGRRRNHYLIQTDVTTIFINNIHWLTTTNEDKVYVTRQAQCKQWLYFIAHNMGDAPKAKVEMFFSNASSVVLDLCTIAYTDFDTIRIRTDAFHPTIANYLTANPGYIFTHYDVWIENEGGQLIKKKIRYQLEEPYFNEKCFYFEASMGGFKTIRCRGKQEYGIEVQSELLEIFTDLSIFSRFEANTVQNQTEYIDVFQSFTGFYRKEELKNLVIDFLISEVVYTFDFNNEEIERVNILPESFSLIRTDDYLYGVLFNWRYSDRQINHSNFIR